MQVLPADGHGVEALRGLHVVLQAAGGQAVQQAGLTGSIQTQNQNLGPCRLHRLGLEHTQNQHTSDLGGKLSDIHTFLYHEDTHLTFEKCFIKSIEWRFGADSSY